MTEILRFWFDRGVDGFRTDVPWHCTKAADLLLSTAGRAQFEEALAPNEGVVMRLRPC